MPRIFRRNENLCKSIGVQSRSKNIGKRNQLARIGSRPHFTRCLRHMMVQEFPRRQISSNALEVMNNFLFDIFDKIATASANFIIHQSKVTLTAQHVRGAIEILMHGELGANIVSYADRALVKFYLSKKNC